MIPKPPNGIDLVQAALDEALEDEIKVGFKGLIGSLSGNITEDGERATLVRFAKMMRLILRARELADKVLHDISKS